MGAAWLGGAGGGAGGGYERGSHSGGTSGEVVQVLRSRRWSARGERMEAAARTAGRCAVGGREKSRESAAASIHEHMFRYRSTRGDAVRVHLRRWAWIPEEL